MSGGTVSTTLRRSAAQNILKQHATNELFVILQSLKKPAFSKHALSKGSTLQKWDLTAFNTRHMYFALNSSVDFTWD